MLLSKNNFKNTLQLTVQNKNWCSAVQLVEWSSKKMCLQPALEDAECLWCSDSANCSRRAEQRWKKPGHQLSNDAMMVLREQTLTQSAATFLHQWPPHDTARLPGMVVPYHVDSDEHGEFKFNSLMHWQSMKVTSSGVMCSYFRAEQTSRAAAFITDWSLSRWFPGRPASVALPQSRRDSTSETTSDCSSLLL